MRPLASVVVCALALSLGACTEDEPKPPPTTATTAPANPDATLPPMPEVASENSANGASTFVGYYIEVLQFAAHTGDTEQLRTLSDAACEGCNRYADLFERVKASGGWSTERDWSKAEESKLHWDPTPGAESFYTTDLSMGPGTIKTASTAPEQEVPTDTSVVTFGLVFDDGWTITQFGSGELG